MWTHLEPQLARLEQVFEPLHEKALQFDRAWSIAELKLQADDVEWLQSWFGYLTPESTKKWIKSEMPTMFDSDEFVTYRHMFGSLLICAGAEICREKSGEDSVWPAIRGILPRSEVFTCELFLSNGQPSGLTKEIIMDAVRALNLRHTMDIEGTQQWFTTMKLQFGFTYRGAKNRLAEWLVNLGRPHAVQYLDGESEFSELASDSFQSLWRVLKQYRQGLIKEWEVRSTLQGNPWVKAHWIDDLLEQAKAKIEILGTGEFHQKESDTNGVDVSAQDFCPIESIGLEWDPGKMPRLFIDMDRQAINNEFSGTSLTELDFFIDGKKIDRWTGQQDGSWKGHDRIYAEPDKLKKQPNLNPRSFVVQSRSGESLVEWDFADSGLLVDVLLFDLGRRGRIVKTGKERLEPNNRYAIVCDRECVIQGCSAVETFERSGNSRKAIRLPSPLDENVCIAFKDFVLWQPVGIAREPKRQFDLILTTPETGVFSLNDRSKLILEGLPEDAESVELLIHSKTHVVLCNNGRWRTSNEVTITPELAAGQRRVRVRFSLGSRIYSQEPRLEFCLLGAAMVRHKQDNATETLSFEVLERGDKLNRSEGTTYLKVWTPKNDKRAVVLEGDCQVGLLRHKRIKLRDIPGHGGELKIMSQGEHHGLGVTCFDKGCVGAFNPPMLGCDAQLLLLSDKNPFEAQSSDYIIYLWNGGEKSKAKLHPLSKTSIQQSSRNRVWKIRDSRYSMDIMAIALTWKGSWLGAWWSLERIRDYVLRQGDLPEQDFAIIKWLRVPVLDPTLSLALTKAVLQTPYRFLDTWLNDSGLPDVLRSHENIPALKSVVRHFLWNDFPPTHAKDVISATGQCNRNSFREDRCLAHLTKLSDISPILLWKGMERCCKCEPKTYRNLLDMFIRTQVGLSSCPNGQNKLINYRLSCLEKRASSASGLMEKRMKDILRERLKSMEKQLWRPLKQDCADLLKLGETQSGRKYLSARMAQHWLDQE